MNFALVIWYLLVLTTAPIFAQTLSSSSSPSPSPSPSTDLLTRLTPVFLPINEAARALFPRTIDGFETPLVVRSSYIYALSRYEIGAACHPTALSFFGVKDKIPKRFCKPLPRIVIYSYINYRLFLVNFPLEAESYGEFLVKQGLDPYNTTMDPKTEIGWANIVASRANEYLTTDGWNSLGNALKTQFPSPYFDTSGYLPVNLAQTPADLLPRPLRWQPLTLPTGFTGAYSSQVHTFPHLKDVKPLVLSKRDLRRLSVRGPYAAPNSRRSVSKADKRKLRKLIDEFFETSRKLTLEQRFFARWWENKFFSLGTFLIAWSNLLGIDQFTYDRMFLSETMTQHDALIVAWKEKVRHDLVRPTTIIRHLLSGTKVKAFINDDTGVGEVDAGEYEPYIPIQPHSEFPSASAVLCAATFEHHEFGLKSILGKDLKIPRYFFPARPGVFPPFPFTETVIVNLTIEEALVSCGKSRLWAGVHFSPSVEEGLKLGRGIGEKTFKQMASLVAGKVPDDCWRCKGRHSS